MWDLGELLRSVELKARIASNSSPGPALIPRRHIYLLIEGSDFTRENLTRAFEKLSAAFAIQSFFAYLAFSNKESLKQLIRASEATVIVDFADTPEGRRIEKEYYSERYPPRTGYFRAYYLRIGRDETFQYTPDKSKEQTIYSNSK